MGAFLCSGILGICNAACWRLTQTMTCMMHSNWYVPELDAESASHAIVRAVGCCVACMLDSSCAVHSLCSFRGTLVKWRILAPKLCTCMVTDVFRHGQPCGTSSQ
jgi:hypothetical protein